MTCQPVSFADAILPYSIDDRGDYPTYHPKSEEGLDIALIMRVMQRLKSPPPLALTLAHQREALLSDRKQAALRMDTQAVHRIESELRKMTIKILDRGACFDVA